MLTQDLYLDCEEEENVKKILFDEAIQELKVSLTELKPVKLPDDENKAEFFSNLKSIKSLHLDSSLVLSYLLLSLRTILMRN